MILTFDLNQSIVSDFKLDFDLDLKSMASDFSQHWNCDYSSKVLSTSIEWKCGICSFCSTR